LITGLPEGCPLWWMAFFNFYLCPMRWIITSLIWIVPGWISLQAQVSYLQQPELRYRVEQCLQYTYNFDFQDARLVQQGLLQETPEHPAPPFLEALIVYWENFPLTPDKEASEHFLELMDRSVELAGQYLDNEGTYLEGVFFDLFGRAFKAMFWADNGRAGKLLPDLATMYRRTKEGFELKDQFVEFYFSTGLYNYYVEAYPEAHPVYKPLIAFMQDGDRQMGLQQLNYSIQHTTYLKVESMLFMSLIQLKYENDLKTAILYAERLHREYPGNIFYQGHLITILLYLGRYPQVHQVLSTMMNQRDDYSEMIRNMAAAFLAEKEEGNAKLAASNYNKTISSSLDFGPIAESFTAIGYMGLSRLASQRGDEKEAQDLAKMASKYTNYPFILLK
jgi:hypothetical protein